MSAVQDTRIADLQRANAALQRQLDEYHGERDAALAREAALAEVMDLVNRSSDDLAPVFDAILERTLRLCGAAFGSLATFDGEVVHHVADRGWTSALREFARQPLGPESGSALYRIAQGEDLVYLADITDDDAYRSGAPSRRAVADLGGARSALWVALRKDAALLGVIMLYRTEVQPFTETQVALLGSFAAQAVIALENARLLSEQREALEQQTAIAEVLRVINASPGNLAPVFEAILDRAMRLCGAAFGFMTVVDGERSRTVATRGVPAAYAVFRERNPTPSNTPISSRGRKGEPFIHTIDLKAERFYEEGDPQRRAIVDLGGARTLLAVPLMRDQAMLGSIQVYRTEVHSFAEKQVALLQNLAAQAVIAMENARLLTETREALAQQTATSEVLKAISASPDDAQPVFELIARRAKELSGAAAVGVFEYDGALMHHRMLEGYGAAAVEQLRRQFPRPPGRHSAAGRAVQSGQINHIRDTNADPDFAMPELEIVRSLLGVPLLHKGRVVGAIALARSETGGFDEAKVALVQSFAEQAVIAITSAETYHALQEQIGHQSATIDVLKSMSASPGDPQPVFELIARLACEVCDAPSASVLTFDGAQAHFAALYRLKREFLEWEAVERFRQSFPQPLHKGSFGCRAMLERRTIHIRDVPADPDVSPDLIAAGQKSNLAVPLLRDGAAIGAISLSSDKLGGFSDTQVALLETFAEQAAIAVTGAETYQALQIRTAELTRSVAELQALEQVLRAVNSSLDLGIVLQSIIDHAVRLSSADEGSIYEFDAAEQVFVPRYATGMSADWLAQLRDRRIRIGETPLGRSAAARAPLHILDVGEEPEDETKRELMGRGVRTLLAVPLLREDKVIGGLVIRRYTAGGFGASTPTLLQTFAGQCVLAIENARLFQEARQARVEAEATLADLRRAQDRLVQSEKMASLGQLTAGIAHEIKNPLNFVNNFSDLSADLLDELHDAVEPVRLAIADNIRTEIDELTATLKGNLEKIAEHGRRADSIVKNMLLHSRSGPGEHRLADLNATVEEALNLAYHGARASAPGFNIMMETRLDPRAGMVDMYPQEITRALLNLISNGFYAAHQRAEVAGNHGFEPTLHLTTRDLGDEVEIRVRDNGTGISVALRDRIFEPFFTTKPTGEGTGLGLSISYDIITQQHAGSITVDSKVGEYSEFTIRLPRTP